MYARARVDSKGRIVLPKEFREALGIWEGDEVLLSIHSGKIIVEKHEDPFEVLKQALRGISFNRSLRKAAEREAFKLIGEEQAS